jgi:solute carrier family 25 phosphate transporter 3
MITTMAYATIASWGWAISGQTKLMIPLVSAMIASILSCISSQPGDMLLSVVSAHEGEKKVADFYKDIIHEGGVRGLFVGIQERFVHVGLIVTVQLFIYDFVKRLCGISATGL